jgi:hypothetical protein
LFSCLWCCYMGVVAFCFFWGSVFQSV